jgi:heme exporter protein D
MIEILIWLTIGFTLGWLGMTIKVAINDRREFLRGVEERCGVTFKEIKERYK